MLKNKGTLATRVVALILSIFIAVFALIYYFASQFIYSSQQVIANQYLAQQVLITQERVLSFFEREQKLIEMGLANEVYQS